MSVPPEEMWRSGSQVDAMALSSGNLVEANHSTSKMFEECVFNKVISASLIILFYSWKIL